VLIIGGGKDAVWSWPEPRTDAAGQGIVPFGSQSRVQGVYEKLPSLLEGERESASRLQGPVQGVP